MADIEENIDIHFAKEVFMNDEAMFKKFLFQFFERDFESKLCDACESGNVQDAFAVAHDIKGLSQSLALKNVGKIISDLTETLRSGNMVSGDDIANFKEAMQSAKNCVDCIKSENLKLF